jgi:DNA-nicking Smr family endonuclease
VKRPLRPEELRLWSAVAATVHPKAGRTIVAPPAEEPAKPAQPAHTAPAPVGVPMHPFRIGEHASPAHRPLPRRDEPEDIEPRRKHRIARERDPIGARIDLHGMTQERARAALHGFLQRSWDEGYRAVLVITGKGSRGDGVLRRHTPEWLAEPALREIVAGISEAHRRHGGEGALYVALKRKIRG